MKNTILYMFYKNFILKINKDLLIFLNDQLIL